MRVLITGGTGFIGSRLALACERRGDMVVVLGQANTPAEADNAERLERAGIKVVRGSVTDPAAVAAAMAGAEVVYHLAAAQHEMNVPDEHFWAVNVGGTKQVLEAALRQDVRRVVHGSTIGVYGVVDGVVDEQTPCRPDNIYGVTKLEGERTALAYGDRVPVVAVRIPETYGPGDRRLLKLLRAVQRGRFVNIGPGRNLHHPMYVDDLVEALRVLAIHPDAAGQVVLLAGRDAVTTDEMVGAVAEAVGTRPPRLRVPLAPVAALAALLELGLRPLGLQPPLHRRRIDFFRKSFSLRPTLAPALGITPRTAFRDGARATAAWYRVTGLLRSPDGLTMDGTTVNRSTVNSDIVPPTSSSPPLRVPHPHAPMALPPEDAILTAKIEPFDSFWEAPANIEQGYRSFVTFYRHNYLRYLPSDRTARILVISCGPGYFVQLLRDEGYTNVLGIDAFPEKVVHAVRRGLPCRVARAFPFLAASTQPWDAIVAEQEINHLTKDESLRFLQLCRERLADGGTLVLHAINGAHPIVGSESRWGNFDHYNAWTAYSLRQVLEYTGYRDVRIFPLNLYVFYRNPLNYVALAWDLLTRLFFIFSFRMVGKDNTIFSKKIGAAGRKLGSG